MRKLCGWLSVMLLFACGCSGNDLPLAATPTPGKVVVPTPTPSNRDPGNWTPWFFTRWQPGIGASLASNATINASVEINDLCVSDIYEQWGARACKRFVVSVPSDGWLYAFLRWDSSAPGFDLNLAGEVVLVAATGRFATSDWKQTDTQVFAKVEPGVYDVLVMSYVQARLPFQLRTELRPN